MFVPFRDAFIWDPIPGILAQDTCQCFGSLNGLPVLLSLSPSATGHGKQKTPGTLGVRVFFASKGESGSGLRSCDSQTNGLLLAAMNPLRARVTTSPHENSRRPDLFRLRGCAYSFIEQPDDGRDRPGQGQRLDDVRDRAFQRVRELDRLRRSKTWQTPVPKPFNISWSNTRRCSKKTSTTPSTTLTATPKPPAASSSVQLAFSGNGRCEGMTIRRVRCRSRRNRPR